MAHAGLRTWLLFGGFYATQYVGIGFFSLALVVVLREQGASLAQLGLLNLLVLPVSLKFLWAPLVDRHGRNARGHYRHWLLPVQALMVVMVLWIGFTEPQGSLRQLWLPALLFSVLVATQDLALDGMATVAFSHAQRPRINSIQVGAGMLGNIVGGALVLWLYPHIGWQGCLNLLAALMAAPLLLLPAWREPLPALHHERPAHLRQYWLHILAFWRSQGQWLCLMALCVFTFGAFGLLAPALVDAGWSMGEIGGSVRVFGSIVGLCSAACAAWLLQRLPRPQALSITALMQALALLALAPALSGHASRAWVYGGVAAYFLAFSPLYACLSAVMMDKASTSAMPATLFTVQAACATLLALLCGALCLWLAEHLGHGLSLVLAIACLLGAAFLARRWPQAVQAQQMQAPLPVQQAQTQTQTQTQPDST